MEERIIVKKKPPKSPVLAGFLAIIPGIGAFYNGQFLKGFIFIFVYAGLISLQKHSAGIQPLAGLLLTGFIIYMIVEAVQTAKNINRKAVLEGEEEIAETEQFPQEFKSGSIFWGLVLIFLGIVLLMANFNVISYTAIFNFWPLLVILIGLKLIVDYLAGKNNRKRGG